MRPMSERSAKADETTRRMKAAVENADLDGFVATLSPEVVLRSPISSKAEFHGTAEMRELMRGVFDTIEDIRYFEELGDDRARTVFYRGRVGSQPIEEACLLRFDEDGLIDEFTLWIRPMPGLTRLAAALGPRLARERSRPRAALVAAAAKPLAWLTAIGDGPLVSLVRPRRTEREPRL
jgi:SnoaL-like domain